MDERLFSQGEVNKIFSHVPSRTLRWWALMKLYNYDSEASDGRGVHRKYRLENLHQIGIVEALTSLNFQAREIQDIMTHEFQYEEVAAQRKPDETKSSGLEMLSLNKIGGVLMKGILMIGKKLSGMEAGKERKSAYKWYPSLGNLIGANVIAWETIEALANSDLVILINLSKIKKKVDELVATIV